MPRKSSRRPRPFEIVIDELAGEQDLWDLDKHLNGCLSGYQTDPSYGAAVYFGLEALWGIARDVAVRANTLDPGQADADWIIDPKTSVPVPWIWIRALGAAWEQYMTEGGTVGHAFGLEGGQGKQPIDDKLTQMLNERAIARWIFSRVQDARAAGEKIRIEDVIQEAAETFGKSDVTIRRAWARFGRRERQRQPE
jgi:hypothetical protein